MSIAIGFLALNFLLSLLLFRIPLNILVPDVSLTIFLLGIATYYVLLLGGLWLIKTGFKKNTRRENIAGVSIIQVVNALFGAVILGFPPSEIHTIFLAILFMSIAIILTTLSMVVQWSQKSFSSLKNIQILCLAC